LVLVSSVLNVSKMTYYVSSGTLKP